MPTATCKLSRARDPDTQKHEYRQFFRFPSPIDAIQGSFDARKDGGSIGLGGDVRIAKLESVAVESILHCFSPLLLRGIRRNSTQRSRRHEDKGSAESGVHLERMPRESGRKLRWPGRFGSNSEFFGEKSLKRPNFHNRKADSAGEWNNRIATVRRCGSSGARPQCSSDRGAREENVFFRVKKNTSFGNSKTIRPIDVGSRPLESRE